MNIWAIFLTGLTTGGLSCLAMQGGLLASVIANGKDTRQPQNAEHTEWLPVAMFLLSKLVAHTLLGFGLGWLGAQLELSLTVRLIFQGLAALFMLATAANLLDLHPIFRYVVFQPPKFMQRWVRNTSRGQALFTPFVLGFMTIFIPCGVTQAMEVLAITSGNPFAGAVIMAAFVLGTSPLFALVGVATAKLSEAFKQGFMKLAAALLVFLALSSINGILIVLNSPVTLTSLGKSVTYFFSQERFAPKPENLVETTAGVQQVLIQINAHGYAPNKIQVKQGIPVELTLETNDTYSCASSFVLRAFAIEMQLAPTDKQTVTFTPTQKGKFTFTCSMGMYSGVLEVI